MYTRQKRNVALTTTEAYRAHPFLSQNELRFHFLVGVPADLLYGFFIGAFFLLL